MWAFLPSLQLLGLTLFPPPTSDDSWCKGRRDIRDETVQWGRRPHAASNLPARRAPSLCARIDRRDARIQADGWRREAMLDPVPREDRLGHDTGSFSSSPAMSGPDRSGSAFVAGQCGYSRTNMGTCASSGPSSYQEASRYFCEARCCLRIRAPMHAPTMVPTEMDLWL